MSVAARGQRRSIGEVLALLKTEFPDVSISKIRFLEGQGLIQPERTESGYRKFADVDLARLRYILRLQKEQFLPLKVIKERLEEQLASNASNGADAGEDAPSGGGGAGSLIGRKDLLVDSGLSEAQLRDLEKFGMVQSESTSQGNWYDSGAMEVARIAARLLASGVEVRHLRIFKTAVDREADLYLQMAPPIKGARNAAARAEAEERLQELSEMGQAMRTELLKQALS